MDWDGIFRWGRRWEGVIRIKLGPVLLRLRRSSVNYVIGIIQRILSAVTRRTSHCWSVTTDGIEYLGVVEVVEDDGTVRPLHRRR